MRGPAFRGTWKLHTHRRYAARVVSGSAPTRRPGAGKAPTLAAVARAAGVSIATASRALTHSPNVSPQAYQRVCAAAHDLGYRRHRAQFGRSVERIRAVAMLIHAPYERIYGDPFYPRLI